jgi:hypothetical protein
MENRAYAAPHAHSRRARARRRRKIRLIRGRHHESAAIATRRANLTVAAARRNFFAIDSFRSAIFWSTIVTTGRKPFSVKAHCSGSVRG